jgi:hypothetical protein
MTPEGLRELGASLVKSENMISSPKAAHKVFESVVDIGGFKTRVRVVLNESDKLRSIHIRDILGAK